MFPRLCPLPKRLGTYPELSIIWKRLIRQNDPFCPSVIRHQLRPKGERMGREMKMKVQNDPGAEGSERFKKRVDGTMSEKKLLREGSAKSALLKTCSSKASSKHERHLTCFLVCLSDVCLFVCHRVCLSSCLLVCLLFCSSALRCISKLAYFACLHFTKDKKCSAIEFLEYFNTNVVYRSDQTSGWRGSILLANWPTIQFMAASSCAR